MNTFFLALISIALSVAAQFCLRAGMAGERVRASLGLDSTFQKLLTVFFDKYVLLGFCLYGLGAVVWLSVLAKWEVSKAYPLVGLGFAFTLLLGWFGGEEVSMTRLAGVLLISSGVYVISRT